MLISKSIDSFSGGSVCKGCGIASFMVGGIVSRGVDVDPKAVSQYSLDRTCFKEPVCVLYINRGGVGVSRLREWLSRA